jgi:hypothetical protein
MRTMGVPRTNEPTFLPLVVSAARSAVDGPPGAPKAASAQVVWRHADAADAAAKECWTALLAGCDSPVRRVLVTKLHELTTAASLHLGIRCWFDAASPHRQRVSDAEARIVEAVRDGDGAEFAEAFVGYDQAVATAVVSVHSRMGSRAG